jgi:dGTP triphosphohydrolase
MSIELSDTLSAVAQTSLSALPALPASPSTAASTVIQVTQVNVQVNNNLQGHDSHESDNKGPCTELSPRQKEIVAQLYEVSKEAAKRIFSVSSLDHVMNISRLLAEIVKLTEKASYRGEKIPGSEKKAIVLELGRQLLQDPEVLSDELARAAAGMAYEAMGESLLETLLDVSKHVNVMVKEVATSCCSALLSCLQKSLEKK